MLKLSLFFSFKKIRTKSKLFPFFPLSLKISELGKLSRDVLCEVCSKQRNNCRKTGNFFIFYVICLVKKKTAGSLFWLYFPLIVIYLYFQAGVTHSAVMYLAIFYVFPLETVGILEINKKVTYLICTCQVHSGLWRCSKDLFNLFIHYSGVWQWGY